MVASRKRPKGVRYYGPFGLSVLVMGLMPRQIGYQDLVALMARQPEVSQRARAHMLASPFGTIHAATFSFPQPVGTLIPEPPRYRLASIDARDADITGAIARDVSGDAAVAASAAARFPERQPQAQGRPPGVAPARGRAAGRGHPRPDAGPGQDRVVPQARRCAACVEAGSRRHRASASRPKPSRRRRRASAVAVATAEPEPRRVRVVSSRAKPTPVKPESAPSTYALASLSPPSRCDAAAETIDDTNAAVRLGRLYFGNSPSRRGGRHHPALAGGRGTADRDAARERSRHQALRADVADRRTISTASRRLRHWRPVRRQARPRRRDGRAQGRGHRRRQAAEDAGRAARPRRASSAPRPRSAWPKRSISNRAASRSAARSRSRRW